MFRVHRFALHLACLEDAELQDAGSHIVEVDVFGMHQGSIRGVFQLAFYLSLQLFQVYLQVEQHFDGFSFTFTQDAQKQMLRTYVAVVKAVGLFLAIGDDVGNSWCKLVVHSINSVFC